jgi:GGDEF domain-containing protein
MICNIAAIGITTYKKTTKSCQPTRYRHQGILADYTLLPVRRSLAKRFKGSFGEKRRSISGIVIDTDKFKQTKAGG